MRPDPAAPDARVLGVLLAGGRGERLGLGVPKAHAMLAGRTLFEHALAALGGVSARVWVAAAPGVALPASGGDPPRFARVDDPPDGGGPLAGIAAVAREASFLAASAEPGARIVTLAVDMPLVSGFTLRTLIASFDALGAAPGSISALLPAPGGRPQPLAGVWSAAAFAALADAFTRGERSVTRASEALGACALDEAALERLGIAEDVTRDVDTAADLAAIARGLRDAGREPA